MVGYYRGYALHCPGAAPSAGVVSCNYHQWTPSVGGTVNYLFLVAAVSGSHRRMQRLLQFRLGSHNLPVVAAAGRFCGIARADRVCTHYGGIAVADELQMIYEFPVFQPLKQQYAALFTSNMCTLTL